METRLAAAEDERLCGGEDQIRVTRRRRKIDGQWLRSLLAHPLTRGLDIDDPRTTELRRRIIREKKFLHRIYQEWYEQIAAAMAPGSEPVLELGSGAGFLEQYIPGLLTSDIFPCGNVKIVLDGQRLPFADHSLRGIAMVDVLHHLPRAREFFAEAARCVRLGGTIVMIEPWNTPWSKWVYSKLHFEPFLPDASQWEFPDRGPLSGANMALPWIMFHRDRGHFEREFSQWRLRTMRPMMPLRLLVSGGVSFRNLMPSFTFPLWRGLERWLAPFNDQLAMFVMIVLERTEQPCRHRRFP
jgi:SAM-dependent methyltransferase